ncbi:guanine nucleotide-binding protein-like 1 [Amphiura filiformis]|uniref:guanine nucleotide-binding protein-like 1 n=1 Tax=Amphiura filiformis TaxID=82378 RepID=UPI003B20DAD3
MPRKKPFSGKQKKKQLQEKRDRKRTDSFGHPRPHAGQSHRSRQQSVEINSSEEQGSSENEIEVAKLNQQPMSKKQLDRNYDPNRFRLHFERESKAELAHRKKHAMQPFQVLPEESLEVDLDYVYKPGSVLDMPKRPPWDYSKSKEQVESREEKAFQEYLANIYDQYEPRQLSYFEINLETWRQLWRVLEMSDIILLITDIRHPALHFPPALYDYITKDLKKHLIMVLNKIDLAPPGLVVAWHSFFKEKFPDIQVVCFTSFPKESTTNSLEPGKVLHRKRRRGTFSAVGPMQLLRACESICHGKVDVSSWRERIEKEIRGEEALAAQITDHADGDTDSISDTSFKEHVSFKDGILTIGCIGCPNVGKSSLMNGLCGRKVVSTSRTPGHTKHFQTIFLTPTVRLCDSPGLVFPSLVDKQLQILSGLYPIAQVQEPYTAVGYLAQRIPVIEILKLKHPDEKDSPEGAASPKWSAYDICDAWAAKRGFITAKAARHDVYRAANNILRLTVEGRLCMCTRPPGYTSQKEHWDQHPETKEIAKLQEKHKQTQSNDELGEHSELTSSGDESDADVESNDVGESDFKKNDDEADERAERRRFSTSNKYALLSTDCSLDLDF